MKENIKRIYVEKKPGFDIDAQGLYRDLKENLGIKGLKGIRIINRYDISGISDEVYQKSRCTIFSEPTVDFVYDEHLKYDESDRIFAVEYLPGQYDQRADSAAQCVQILTQREKPTILSARVVILKGDITDEDFVKIKNYCINSVDSREAALEKPTTLDMDLQNPNDVQLINGFISMDDEQLKEFMDKMGVAMSFEDLKFCQDYFKDTEKRDPTITELRVIDTYWSDHCRHTTFLTKINDVKIQEGKYNKPVVDAYKGYLDSRKFVYEGKKKDVCLMDIALMGMKELKKRGMLKDLDESDEINASSIVVDAEINGKTEKWLVMFKNETHNHPTEIEPYGGAATCLGGAIRDPLSGRSYVYQAMRVTGSGDPRTRLEDTLPGKLPQRKITLEAAHGFSSYGNQIGLATGQVSEIYDEGYIAKRMEIGAVIGAAPAENVVREKPQDGDAILLVGGRTGRDGCGGATGSSKEHTVESINTCGAEVQKGNPPIERKLQRLFRNPDVSKLIKRCNDFGAGGVSVAVGELSDGLVIDLDKVPKKYEGLDGTELAISESQERMAVVVDKENVEEFIRLAHQENLEATEIARVTDDNRMKMFWRGKPIVDISRDFLNTNGVTQVTDVEVVAPDEDKPFFNGRDVQIVDKGQDLKDAWLSKLQDLNVCSQRGLVERFDSTIGAGSVFLPYGGKYQATPAEGMAAKLPVINGDTSTGTIMAYGYNPALAKWSPFHGAVYAIVEAVAKIVSMGGDYRTTRLTLQEYFEKPGKTPSRWGKPFGALLGALYAQKELGIPAIGGKDSMSGTFMDLDVPPTLVAFALDVVDVNKVVSQEFKEPGNRIVIVPVIRDDNEMPDFVELKKSFAKVRELICDGKVLAASTVKGGGLVECISKMTFGNRIGMILNEIETENLFSPDYGNIVLEVTGDLDLDMAFGDVKYRLLGNTTDVPTISVNGVEINVEDAYKCWEGPLEKIFPTKANVETAAIPTVSYNKRFDIKPHKISARPRVFIPVFPGTNCEYDSARAFEKAGGIVSTFVFKNLTGRDIEESIEFMKKAIDNSQIIMIPGGFSAGDEPDGSGKFIATVFRNPVIKDAVMSLLNKRDGLILGICNGFQALIKLGLVPYGEIRDIDESCPTLTYNTIGRHVSRMVHTKVVSVLSPWFNNVKIGEIHTVAVSHGEGRFVASESLLQSLKAHGQIATQYVDLDGNPTMDSDYNPNGSIWAVEGITSPDGRVFGKMGHSERIGKNVAKNVPGNKDQKIFEAGVRYFM